MYSASFDPNRMILARTILELSHGKSEIRLKQNIQVKFDIEGQGQSPPKTIGLYSKVFCIFSSKLDDSSSNECLVITRTKWMIDGRTHRRRQRQYLMAKMVSGENEIICLKLNRTPPGWQNVKKRFDVIKNSALKSYSTVRCLLDNDMHTTLYRHYKYDSKYRITYIRQEEDAMWKCWSSRYIMKQREMRKVLTPNQKCLEHLNHHSPMISTEF